MKQINFFILGGVLAVSLTLNIFLWSRLSRQSQQLKSAQASASEIDELRRQNQELQAKRKSTPDSAGENVLELARLRNELGQLRKRASEAEILRTQAAEAAQLRAQLAAATQDLARAETALANAVNLSPEALQQMKEEALSVQCVNNLKKISSAAWRWAKDHGNVFPEDFLAMKDELVTPKILFCPADHTTISVAEWSQLNPSLISYRLNPNGVTDPAAPLATCSIHAHSLFTDGSVHRQ